MYSTDAGVGFVRNRNGIGFVYKRVKPDGFESTSVSLETQSHAGGYDAQGVNILYFQKVESNRTRDFREPIVFEIEKTVIYNRLKAVK